MPLPMAHAAAGLGAVLILPQSIRGSLTREQVGRFVLLLVILANMPDLDFLPGLAVGDPHRYHHGISHSLLVALIMTAVAFWATRGIFSNIPAVRMFMCLLLATCSHALLDFFSVDTSTPYGVPLLWPLSDDYLISPYPLFLDVVRSGESSSAFVTSLFSLHNLQGLGVEALFAAAVVGLLIFGCSRTHSPGWWLGITMTVGGASGFLLAGGALTEQERVPKASKEIHRHADHAAWLVHDFRDTTAHIGSTWLVCNRNILYSVRSCRGSLTAMNNNAG